MPKMKKKVSMMTKTRHTSQNSDIKMIGYLFEEPMYHEKDFKRKGL